jgi:hypothetical protein
VHAAEEIFFDIFIFVVLGSVFLTKKEKKQEKEKDSFSPKNARRGDRGDQARRGRRGIRSPAIETAEAATAGNVTAEQAEPFLTLVDVKLALLSRALAVRHGAVARTPQEVFDFLGCIGWGVAPTSFWGLRPT